MGKKFEDVLKEKFKDLELDDNADGWKSLQQDFKKKHVNRNVRVYYVAASISILFIVFAIYFFLGKKDVKIQMADSTFPKVQVKKGDIDATENKIPDTFNLSTSRDKIKKSKEVKKKDLELVPKSQYLTYKTDGQPKVFTLPDSSLVTLNAYSELRILVFDQSSRTVSLSGEGYFEVEKAASKPFRIVSGKLTVEVVGTKFNIRNRSIDSTEVTVTEGKVKCTIPSARHSLVYLSAGESACYQNGLLTKLNEADPNTLFWKTNLLIFQNQTLEDVTDQLNNLFNININVENESLKHCHLTFKVKNPTPEKTIQLMKSLLGFTYSMEGKKVSITGKGCQ